MPPWLLEWLLDLPRSARAGCPIALRKSTQAASICLDWLVRAASVCFRAWPNDLANLSEQLYFDLSRSGRAGCTRALQTRAPSKRKAKQIAFRRNTHRALWGVLSANPRKTCPRTRNCISVNSEFRLNFPHMPCSWGLHYSAVFWGVTFVIKLYRILYYMITPPPFATEVQGGLQFVS